METAERLIHFLLASFFLQFSHLLFDIILSTFKEQLLASVM